MSSVICLYTLPSEAAVVYPIHLAFFPQIGIHVTQSAVLGIMKIECVLLLNAEIYGGGKKCPISSSIGSTNESLVFHSNETVAFINLTLTADE